MKAGSLMKQRPPGLGVWIAAGSAVLGSCVALALSISEPIHPKNASLVLSKDVRDLGQTSIQGEQRVSFLVRNAGTRRLVLNELDRECGCGKDVVRTILVAPGTTVEVNVPFDTRTATGPVENIASFTTNDPTQPRFDLTVRAFVVADKPMLPDRGDRKLGSVLNRS